MRVFTIREANRILPTVEEAVRFIRARATEIVQAQDRIDVLLLIGAEDEKSPDHADLRARQKEMDDLVASYNGRLDELNRIGCVVKDLNTGLVDFYGKKRDRLVFLCWKLGERRISYWHELEAGFAGRRPIRELRQEEEES